MNENIVMLLLATGDEIDFEYLNRHNLLTPELAQHYMDVSKPDLVLMDLTRVAIRKYLREASPVNLFVRVPHLGLPSLLADYLLYGITLEDCIENQ